MGELSILIMPIIFWSVGFGISALVEKKYHQFSYANDFLFLVLSILGLYFFRDLYEPLLGWKFLIIIVCVVVGNIFFNLGAYHLVRKYGKEPSDLIKKNPQMQLLRISNLFAFSKPFEILFQQVAFGALIFTGLRIPIIAENIVMYTGLLFGILHLPILFMKKRFAMFSYLFLVGSFVLGVVFAWLAVNYQYGLFITYTLHLQLYIIVGAVIWLFPSLIGSYPQK